MIYILGFKFNVRGNFVFLMYGMEV